MVTNDICQLLQNKINNIKDSYIKNKHYNYKVVKETEFDVIHKDDGFYISNNDKSVKLFPIPNSTYGYESIDSSMRYLIKASTRFPCGEPYYCDIFDVIEEYANKWGEYDTFCRPKFTVSQFTTKDGDKIAICIEHMSSKMTEILYPDSFGFDSIDDFLQSLYNRTM